MLRMVIVSVLVLVCAACAPSRRASENWQDAPRDTRAVQVNVAFPGGTLSVSGSSVSVDSGGDVSGDAQADQAGDAAATATTDASVPVNLPGSTSTE